MQTYKIKHVSNGKALRHVQQDFGATAINYLKQNFELINPTFLESFQNDYNLECLSINNNYSCVYFNTAHRKTGFTNNGKRRIQLDDSYSEKDLFALIQLDKLSANANKTISAMVTDNLKKFVPDVLPVSLSEFKNIGIPPVTSGTNNFNVSTTIVVMVVS